MNPVNEFEKYAVKHHGISSNTLNDYNKHVVTNLTPNIIEERPMNVAVMDVYSALMNGACLCPFDVRSDGMMRVDEWRLSLSVRCQK